MDKNLYIDASHPEETRIVLKSKLSIEEYEYEDKNRVNFKNNIYLGTISRVEPSLQAAFVDFGRVKHGFLAFNDIQSDYYQIPSADKEKLKNVEEKYLAVGESVLAERAKGDIKVLERSYDSIKKGNPTMDIFYEHLNQVKSDYIINYNPCQPFVDLDKLQKIID